MEYEKMPKVQCDFDEDLSVGDFAEATPLTNADTNAGAGNSHQLPGVGTKTNKASLKKTSWIRLARSTLLFGLAAWGAAELTIKAIYAVHQTRSCSCGTSIAEALNRGCVFDPLVPAWVPPHCRDDELTEEFRYQVRDSGPQLS
jgi:hypothetical protein